MNHDEAVHHTMNPAMHHTMQGLPDWAFYLALAFVLLVAASSLWRPTRRSRHEATGSSTWRFELTTLPGVRWLVSRRPFQFAFQVPLVAALFLILATGFFGTPVAERNFATVAVWTLWWTLLIVDIVLLGRMWCMVCPWEALASWTRRLAFWKRRAEEPLALELKWPRWLRNVYPATFLFVGLTWLELGFGVTRSPRATAILGLTMVLLAVVPALIFEKRSFCKYGCLVGRICGLYSLLAPVEVRARDLDVCATCRTKDCLKGNENGYPCPTGQCLAAMRTNTYCTVCTECLKSCPNDNVALNVRPWGADLHTLPKPRKDEAILALVMLSLTSFHGLTMTPAWSEALAWTRATTGLGYLTAFSLGMALMLLLPGAIYLASSAVVARLASTSLTRAASLYAYPLIAIALMYHLAHNAGHFLVEAGNIVPVASDPFGSGSDLLKTAGFVPGPLASQGATWVIQIALVLIGFVWALRVTDRFHHRLPQRRLPQRRLPQRRLPQRRLPHRRLPHHRIDRIGLRLRVITTAFLLGVTVFNLWLLAQPMEMRTGM